MSTRFLIGCVVLMFLMTIGCSGGHAPKTPAIRSDLVDKKVVLHISMCPPIELPPRLRRLFLQMLSQDPVKSSISRMPAKPWGSFDVGDDVYFWHGNAVIHGRGEEERLWSGPVLQELIRLTTKEEGLTEHNVRAFLQEMEVDSNLENIPMEGPGAYPGGGDALHPIELPF